ncbi:MAG: hypothetical protein WCJ19_05635 [bacterium]
MEIKDYYTYLNTGFKFEGQPRKDYLNALLNLNKGELLNEEDVIIRQTQDLVSYLERQEAQRKAAEAEQANAEKLQEQLEFKEERDRLDQIVADRQLNINQVLIEGATNAEYLRAIEEAIEIQDQDIKDEQIKQQAQEELKEKELNANLELASLQEQQAGQGKLMEQTAAVLSASLLNKVPTFDIINDVLKLTKSSITKKSIAKKDEYIKDIKAYTIGKKDKQLNADFLGAIEKDSGAKILLTSNYIKYIALGDYKKLNYLTEEEKQEITKATNSFKNILSENIMELRKELRKAITTSKGYIAFLERIDKANAMNQQLLIKNIADPNKT